MGSGNARIGRGEPDGLAVEVAGTRLERSADNRQREEDVDDPGDKGPRQPHPVSPFCVRHADPSFSFVTFARVRSNLQPSMFRSASKTVAVAGLAAMLHAESSARADLPDNRDHALPCRPTIACTADFVLPGMFEVEAGVLYRRIDANGRQWTFPLLLKQTLTKAVQLQVGSNGYSIAKGDVPQQFLDDVTVGPKLHLLDQGDVLPSVSLSAIASIPTFRGEGYLRTYDALFTGYVTKDIGPIHADWNLGTNLWRVERPLPQVWTALALSVNLPSPFGAMVEGYAFSNAMPVASRDGGVLFAISETPRPWLVFDQGADVGFFPSTRSYSLFVGLTIVPAVLWR